MPTRQMHDGDWGCTLRRGDVTRGVTRLKIALNRCYGAELRVDRVYGPGTAAAVRWVRVSLGLSDHAVYGPRLRAKMEWPVYYNGDFSHCEVPG